MSKSPAACASPTRPRPGAREEARARRAALVARAAAAVDRTNPHNEARSRQNLKDLKTLGFDEASGGREALMKLFEKGSSLPESARHVIEHGVTITRTVKVEDVGAIDVKCFIQAEI